MLEGPRLTRRGCTVQARRCSEEPGPVVLVLQDASAALALDRQMSAPQRGAQRHRHGGDPGA